MRNLPTLVAFFALLCLSELCLAGGDPTRVLILVNEDDPDAEDVAQHYLDKRKIPAGHLCSIAGVEPDAPTINFGLYQSTILDTLDTCLAALPQGEEIDYLVIIRGLPYVVKTPKGTSTSLSAMLQIRHGVNRLDGGPIAGMGHFKQGNNAVAGVPNPLYISGPFDETLYPFAHANGNWYTASAVLLHGGMMPNAFERSRVEADGLYDLRDNLFIVTRLDGFDYQDAKDLVDRSVASDGTFPSAEFLCMEGAEPPRQARDPECAYVMEALNNTESTGVYISPHDSGLSGHEVAAYFTGAANLRDAIDGLTYVPGAITCNLTSVGAQPQNFVCADEVCPAVESQTSIARFVRAGATGAHGAVAEPTNNCFPNASALLLYSLGYNLGESYFFSQRFLYWRNLILGDPLASPYALRPTVEISWDEATEEMTVLADHPNGIASVRLYVNGVLVESTSSASLTSSLPEVETSHWDVLAVATAANLPIERPLWPLLEYAPMTDTRGWTREMIQRSSEGGFGGNADVSATTETSLEEPSTEKKTGGGGCAHHENPARTILFFLSSVGVSVLFLRKGWLTMRSQLRRV